MQIPVYDISTNKPTTIDIEDILFINADGHKILIQTKDNIYRPLSSLKDYLESLQEYGFEKLENSAIVNVKKITRVDKRMRIAYFDNDGYPTLACVVSRRNLDKIKHLRK